MTRWEPRQYQFFIFIVGTLVLWNLETLHPLVSGERRDRLRHALVNFSLYLFKIGAQLALSFVLVETVSILAARKIGLLHAVTLPDWAALVIGLVLLDLGAYLLHRLSHTVPLFWRLHRVHHSDPVVDVTTYFRTHPGEVLLMWIWQLMVVALVGVSLATIEVAIGLTMAVALLQHANVALPRPLERTLGLMIVTSTLHRIHHSQKMSETNSNYGPVLVIWDKIFSTFRPAKVGAITYGLREFADKRWQSLSGMLLTPFTKA